MGKGAFGMVYAAFDAEAQETVAIKIESPACKKPVLKLEAAILKSITQVQQQQQQVAPGHCAAARSALGPPPPGAWLEPGAATFPGSLDGLPHFSRYLAAGKFTSAAMVQEAEARGESVAPWSYVVMQRLGPK